MLVTQAILPTVGTHEYSHRMSDVQPTYKGAQAADVEVQDWYDAGASDSGGEFFERIIERTYRQILRPGDTAVDCGANRGRHTYPMLNAVGPDGHIAAIEPLPTLARSLSRELKDRGVLNCTIVPKAVGREEAVRPFVWVGGDDSYSGLLKRDLPAEFVNTTFSFRVAVTTLDTIAVCLPKTPRFLKMDLEGGEFHALLGASRTLAAGQCFVVFENGRQSAANTYGYQKEELFALFEDLNYAVYDLFGRRFGAEQWQAAKMPWYTIAVAKSSADEKFVRDKQESLVRSVYIEWLSAKGDNE
jgi:FkbM family methyltransferase